MREWSEIAFYTSGRRQAGTDPQKIKITHPTTVLWGKADPVILARWSDQLGQYFSNVQLCLLERVGHFVPFEAPEEVVAAISAHL